MASNGSSSASASAPPLGGALEGLAEEPLHRLPMGATAALIASTRRLLSGGIPEATREWARHCVLDFFACAIAGAGEPLTRILAETLVDGEHATTCSLIGREERATPSTATLINGAAAHALDYDDTHSALAGHPTAPVLPALLTLCECAADRSRASGERLLDALTFGIELECRLGLLLGAELYALGFHATATLGTFGAAAACARWLNLDEQQLEVALGLAGTMAAGLKSSFGTMAKPLHAGRAASAGWLAARLAHNGFTGAAAMLERTQGFAATHGGATLDARASARLTELDGRFLTCETLFKHHASCYLTHAPINATNELRSQLALAPDEVEGVTVVVAPALLGVCNIEEPHTGLEAKFSLRATVAMALLGLPTAELATFSDETVARPELRAMLERVSVETRDMPRMHARVRLRARGSTFDAESDTAVPSTDLTAQRRLLEDKFDRLVDPLLGAQRALALRSAIARLGAEEDPDAALLLRLSTTGS